MAVHDYFYGLGRRKSSTAQVRLTKGEGQITVNKVPAEQYFADSHMLMHELGKPLLAISREGEFNISAQVKGGGHRGQADAIKLGISKALANMNEDLKSTLRRADLLGRDPRKRERKKFGLKGARKQRQFTKR